MAGGEKLASNPGQNFAAVAATRNRSYLLTRYEVWLPLSGVQLREILEGTQSRKRKDPHEAAACWQRQTRKVFIGRQVCHNRFKSTSTNLFPSGEGDQDRTATDTELVNDSEQPPPLKRARIASTPPLESKLSGATQQLLCPFAVVDPERYIECLTRHCLRSNRAVARHLRSQHRRPPYCPTCWELFASNAQRDNHIRLRQCASAAPVPIDGLTVKQLDELLGYIDLDQRDNHLGTWGQIFRLVFPHLGLKCGLLPTAMLETSVISHVRTVWRAILTTMSGH